MNSALWIREMEENCFEKEERIKSSMSLLDLDSSSPSFLPNHAFLCWFSRLLYEELKYASLPTQLSIILTFLATHFIILVFSYVTKNLISRVLKLATEDLFSSWNQERKTLLSLFYATI